MSRYSLFVALLALYSGVITPSHLHAQMQATEPFMVMFYNVENLFDCEDDPLKDDQEFLPTSSKRWTPQRLWQKIDHTSQVIAAAGNSHLPELVGLCEVENDTVINMLTRCGPLRSLGYDYLITHSPDKRGVNVALLYQPTRFRLIHSREVVINTTHHKALRPTRNILYAQGIIPTGDTLHIMVCHMPSRMGKHRDAKRRQANAMLHLAWLVDSVYSTHCNPLIMCMGDFNDDLKKMPQALDSLLIEPQLSPCIHLQVKGTYKYKGDWDTIDHILVSPTLFHGKRNIATARQPLSIYASPAMLEDDKTYGGVKPKRSYQGPIWKGGFSDHLPVVLRLTMHEEE